MKKREFLKPIILLAAFALFLISSGCNTNINQDVSLGFSSAPMNFIVINNSAEGEIKPSADGNSNNVTTNLNVSFTMIINGQSTVITTVKKSNELPVLAGNELEIIFTPSCSEETTANFTLPDGTIKTVTVDSPSFAWTVPNNFISGMAIKGESEYKKDKWWYKGSGAVYLITIRK